MDQNSVEGNRRNKSALRRMMSGRTRPSRTSSISSRPSRRRKSSRLNRARRWFQRCLCCAGGRHKERTDEEIPNTPQEDARSPSEPGGAEPETGTSMTASPTTPETLPDLEKPEVEPTPMVEQEPPEDNEPYNELRDEEAIPPEQIAAQQTLQPKEPTPKESEQPEVQVVQAAAENIQPVAAVRPEVPDNDPLDLEAEIQYRVFTVRAQLDDQDFRQTVGRLIDEGREIEDEQLRNKLGAIYEKTADKLDRIRREVNRIDDEYQVPGISYAQLNNIFTEARAMKYKLNDTKAEMMFLAATVSACKENELLNAFFETEAGEVYRKAAVPSSHLFTKKTDFFGMLKEIERKIATYRTISWQAYYEICATIARLDEIEQDEWTEETLQTLRDMKNSLEEDIRRSGEIEEPVNYDELTRDDRTALHVPLQSLLEFISFALLYRRRVLILNTQIDDELPDVPIPQLGNEVYEEYRKLLPPDPHVVPQKAPENQEVNDQEVNNQEANNQQEN